MFTINSTGTVDFIRESGSIPVIDVRTPSEYTKGHIPGAINIPLFSDDERSMVGTIYKQESQIAAILKGLDIAGPKLSSLLKKGIDSAGKDKRLLLYCWRGGNRSKSMAWLFSNAGIECTVLEGGYKAFRKYLLSELGNISNLIVLGGLTGSGKTDILQLLSDKGEQVIDLEGLARHKGSAFGALGQKEQPTTEHFANLLFYASKDFDKGRRIFIEDESHNIGSVNLPDNFFDKIREAQVIALMPEVDERIPRLLNEYGKFSKEKLIDSVMRISKRLGGASTREAIQLIREGNLEKAIRIVLQYYDKAYRYGLEQRPDKRIFIIEPSRRSPEEDALRVLEIADKIITNP